jgi:integrase
MTTTKRRRRARGDGSVRLRSDGRWEGRVEAGWSAEGRRKRTSVFGNTKEVAAARLREEQDRVGKGQAHQDGRTTVETFLVRWLKVVEPRLRPATMRRYRGICEHQLIPALGRFRLTKLEPSDVATALAQLQEGGLAPQTVSHCRSVLRTALSSAQKWREVRENVVKLTDAPRVPRPSPKTLPPAEVHRVLEAVSGSPIGNLVALGLRSGMRQGELLGLRWSDIDLQRRQLTVGASLQRLGGEFRLVEPKSEHSRRTLRLSAPALAALQSERQQQLEAQLAVGPLWKPPIADLVFTGPLGRPLMGTSVTRQFKTALARHGLAPLRFHHLRHLNGSLMLASGVDLATVSHMLGHSSVALTASTYAGILPTLRDDAVDRLERLLSQPS